jgi:hypothetical protein
VRRRTPTGRVCRLRPARGRRAVADWAGVADRGLACIAHCRSEFLRLAIPRGEPHPGVVRVIAARFDAHNNAMRPFTRGEKLMDAQAPAHLHQHDQDSGCGEEHAFTVLVKPIPAECSYDNYRREYQHRFTTFCSEACEHRASPFPGCVAAATFRDRSRRTNRCSVSATRTPYGHRTERPSQLV